MIYATADIHGEYKQLMEVLEIIDFKKKDKLYIVGDAIDRGNNSLEIINFAMKSPNVIYLLGNHEQSFLDVYKRKDNILKANWYQYGGYTTDMQFEKLSKFKQADIINFLETRPLYSIEKNFILSHSGYVLRDEHKGLSAVEIMESQDIDDLLWSKAEFYDNKGIDNHITIFGHVLTCKINNNNCKTNKDPKSIWIDPKYNDKIGIDCGANFSEYNGRLAVLSLEDLQVYYSENSLVYY